MEDLLNIVAKRANQYHQDLSTRSVAPHPAAVEELAQLDVALPEHPTDPATVVEILDRIGSPATVASAGGRYFGFVVGRLAPGSPGRQLARRSLGPERPVLHDFARGGAIGGDLASLAVGTFPSACRMCGLVRHRSNDG